MKKKKATSASDDEEERCDSGREGDVAGENGDMNEAWRR